MLTSAQLTTFASAINTDTGVNGLIATHGWPAIADYYNTSAGTGSVWRPCIEIPELNTAIIWSEFSGLTVALQNTYLAMTADGSVDATSSNIRSGFSTVFSGKVSLTNLTAIASRVPTRFEALFTTANVCSLFGYRVTASDVMLALGV